MYVNQQSLALRKVSRVQQRMPPNSNLWWYCVRTFVFIAHENTLQNREETPWGPAAPPHSKAFCYEREKKKFFPPDWIVIPSCCVPLSLLDGLLHQREQGRKDAANKDIEISTSCAARIQCSLYFHAKMPPQDIIKSRFLELAYVRSRGRE